MTPPAPDAAARERLLALVPAPQPEPEAAPVTGSVEEMLAALRCSIKTDEEVEQWTWRNEIAPRMVEAGFSARHITRLTLTQPQERTLDSVDGICCGKGAIVALVGSRGTGKTSLAAQLVCRRIERSRPLVSPQDYRKLVSLIARYKAIYADHGTIEGEALQAARDAYCRIPLAVIDEIHEAEDSKLKNKILTDILDRRYAGLKDTILISNQTADEFHDTIGDSIISRMEEHGSLIECNWGSFRTR